MKNLRNTDTTPFSSGVRAFALRPNSETGAKEAIGFIDSELRKPAPLQVRWAMFWLGQWRIKEGIPLLLKYIDYRYSTSWLVEESYPAVRALQMMGEAAIPQLIESIASEQQQTRLNLLLHALVLTRMGPHGTPDLVKLKADVPNAEKQKLLLTIVDAVASGSEPFVFADVNPPATVPK